MAITIKDFALGRKSFFITPDMSLFPENYLEDYFALGYECYFVEYNKNMPLDQKIDMLVSIFHDIILIFNIDYSIPDLNWYNFISDLQFKYENKIYIGVTFVKKPDKEVKGKLEKLFNYDLGIKCGCVQLEYNKNENFWIIQKILYANQAQGRRKNIRALCTKAYTFAFFHEGTQYSGTMQDISLSHFSFIYPNEKLNIKEFERIDAMDFRLKGLLIRANAVLMMKRAVGEHDTLYVFAFLDDNGLNGLSERYKQLVVPNIYNLMVNNYRNLLGKVTLSMIENKNLPNNVEDMEINL